MVRKRKKNFNKNYKVVNNQNDFYNLKHYLHNLYNKSESVNQFSEEMQIDSDGHFRFHWANWERSAQHLKNRLKENPDKLNNINKDLEEHRDTLIWLKGPKVSLKSNLYELYHFYSDYKVRSVWFSKHKDFLISTHTEAGPYITLGELRWLDRNLYKSFVYKKMLRQTISYRKLRISCELPIECHFNHHEFHSSTFMITQLSSKGIFLKFSGGRVKAELLNSHGVTFKVNLSRFKNLPVHGMSKWKDRIENLKDHTSVELRLPLHVLKEYENKENLISEVEGEYYFFVGLDDFVMENDDFPFSELIRNFVEAIEIKFTKELEMENDINIAC